jgi:hypothetical protein
VDAPPVGTSGHVPVGVREPDTDGTAGCSDALVLCADDAGDVRALVRRVGVTTSRVAMALATGSSAGITGIAMLGSRLPLGWLPPGVRGQTLMVTTPSRTAKAAVPATTPVLTKCTGGAAGLGGFAKEIAVFRLTP